MHRIYWRTKQKKRFSFPTRQSSRGLHVFCGKQAGSNKCEQNATQMPGSELHKCNSNNGMSRYFATLLRALPTSATVDSRKINTQPSYLSEEGAFVNSEVTGSCQPVVVVTLESINDCLGFHRLER
jgi:hypothetical protein